MQNTLGGHMLAFSETNMNMAQSLFNSEGYFWLTAAVASSFAVEEVIKYDPKATELIAHKGDDVLAMFNQCIRKNRILDDEINQAKQWTQGNLALIDGYNSNGEIFDLPKGLMLSKCFTTYWLIFKLIEIEWQEVLGMEEVAEAYQFLDTIIADGEELEDLETCYQEQQAFSDDQKVYLRSHWRRISMFWRNLRCDLTLLAEGFLKYETIIS